eukprot:tig00021133_g18911.t1
MAFVGGCFAVRGEAIDGGRVIPGPSAALVSPIVDKSSGRRPSAPKQRTFLVSSRASASASIRSSAESQKRGPARHPLARFENAGPAASRRPASSVIVGGGSGGSGNGRPPRRRTCEEPDRPDDDSSDRGEEREPEEGEADGGFWGRLVSSLGPSAAAALVAAVILAGPAVAEDAVAAKDAVKEAAADAATKVKTIHEVCDSKTREYFVDPSGKLVSMKDRDSRPPLQKAIGFLQSLFLPEGYPDSVTPDYINFCKWRSVQNVASSFLMTMSSQSLLYAVGLGKGAIPTAQAINWVLKDGVGYFTKVLFGSRFGKRFDDDPKRWRMAADFLEDIGMAFEVMAPIVPNQFLLMASFANAAKSVAGMTQSATRNCFYKSFAKRENLGDITAKGEAQVMSCKLIGMSAGIYATSSVRENTALRLSLFSLVAAVHLFANLQSYRAVVLSQLNRQRTALLVDEYLKEKKVEEPAVINARERVFSPPFLPPPVERIPIHLGARISECVRDAGELEHVRSLYGNENYLLNFRGGKVYVAFREKASSSDLLKGYFQAQVLSNLVRGHGHGPKDDAEVDALLRESHAYTMQSFGDFARQLEAKGWATTHVLLAAGPNRVLDI